MTLSNATNTGCTPVEELSALLSPPQVARFARKAIPELRQGQAALLQSLENQHWKAAAQQAHKLKSTMCLLSANNLVNNLDLIESGDNPVIQSPEFRASVANQCQQLINGLDAYLSGS